MTVPAKEVTMDDWTGTGYIIMDPASGAGAYRISGGLNGGIITGLVTTEAILGTTLMLIDIATLVSGMVSQVALLATGMVALSPGVLLMLVVELAFLIAAIYELVRLINLYVKFLNGDLEVGEQVVTETMIGAVLTIVFGSIEWIVRKCAGALRTSWKKSKLYKKIKELFGDVADDIETGSGDGDGPGNTDGDNGGNTDGDGPGNTDGDNGGNTDGDGPGNTDGDNGGNTDGDGPGNTDGDNDGNTDGDGPGNTDGDNTGGDGDVNGTPGGTGNTGGTGDGNLAGSGGGGSSDNTGNGTGTATGILTYEEVEELAFNAIKGKKNAEYVVLGKYDNGGPTSYVEVAKDMDAQYFQLDNWNELAEKYSDDEIWKINEKFLDIQMSSGREIYLSHDPKKSLGDGTFYAKELQYLKENGYRIVDEGGIWHAIR